MAKTCFVLMGFGEKMDSRSYRKLKPDKTGRIIQSAVLADRESAVRVRKQLQREEGAAKTIRQSGMILE
jgi:hypothetical protein